IRQTLEPWPHRRLGHLETSLHAPSPPHSPAIRPSRRPRLVTTATIPNFPPFLLAPSRDGVSAFIRRLSVSQWLLLLFPVLLFAVRSQREAQAVDVVDGSAVAQIIWTAICALWLFYRCFNVGKAIRYLLFSTPLVFLFAYASLAIASLAWTDKIELTVF